MADQYNVNTDPGGQQDYDLWVQLQSDFAAASQKKPAPGSHRPEGGTGAAGETPEPTGGTMGSRFMEVVEGFDQIATNYAQSLERLGEVPTTWDEVVDRFATVIGMGTPVGAIRAPVRRPSFEPSVTRWPRLIYDTPYSPGNPERLGGVHFRMPDPANPSRRTNITAANEEELYNKVAQELGVSREMAEDFVENIVVVEPNAINYQTGAGRALTREQYDQLIENPSEFYSQQGFSRPTKPVTFLGVKRMLDRMGLKIYRTHDHRGSTYIRFGPPDETYLESRMIPTIRIPKDGHAGVAHDPAEYGVLYDTAWRPATNTPLDLNLAADRWGRPYADIRVLEDTIRERYFPGTTPRSMTQAERAAQEETERQAQNQLELPLETIKESAIKIGNQTFTGSSHFNAMERAAQDLGISIDEVISRARPDSDGFITSTGRFVDRREAAVIAEQSGQRQGRHLDTDRLASEDLMRLGGPGTRPQTESTVEPTTFIPEGSAGLNTNELAAFEEAKEMEGAYDNDTIRRTTGWFKNKENQWRYEISDQNASINLDMANFRPGIELSLKSVLNHPVLYRIAPHLNDYSIEFYSNKDDNRQGYVYGDKNDKKIYMNLAYFPDSDIGKERFLSTLLHEIQHTTSKERGEYTILRHFLDSLKEHGARFLEQEAFETERRMNYTDDMRQFWYPNTGLRGSTGMNREPTRDEAWLSSDLEPYEAGTLRTQQDWLTEIRKE